MRFTSFCVATALAGLVYAAPVQLEGRALTTSYVIEVVTSYTTVYPGAAQPSPVNLIQERPKEPEPEPTAAPASPPPPPPPAAPETTEAPPAPTEAPASPPPTRAGSGNFAWTSVSPAQCAGQTAVPANFDASPTWCGVEWIHEINVWRTAYNKPTFTWDSALARVALTAASRSRGDTQAFEHTDLGNSPARGENMAGGWSTVQLDSNGSNKGVTPFGHALVQGWLAESPSDPQLQASGFTGIDQTFDPQYVYAMENGVREKGHHEIFLGDYTKIGCAFSANPSDGNGGGGIYVCDFA